MANDADSSPTNPLSLQRLKDAFARMLAPGEETNDSDAAAHDDGVNLTAILEGVLFVGGDDARPRTAEELAAALRDVTPDEVDAAIADLNRRYDQDAAPYHIEASAAGYRLRLDDNLGRLRDKFYGRVREAKLTPAALEVLSVVAYRQPTTATVIDQLRGSRSNSHLANLVRRGLVRVDREGEKTTQYRTTDRFLKLFGLEDLDQLPRAAELD